MFSAKVREKLRYYVYLYVDPRTETVFCVGKGQGNRAYSHLRDRSESGKVKVIEELDKLGKEPRIEILRYGLTEKQALLVESSAMDLLEVHALTNKVRGQGSQRATAQEVSALLDAREAIIKEPVVLINISGSFRYGMSPQELYDATRSCWRIAGERVRAQYVMGVYRGVVREVYAVAAWVPGGSTMRSTDVDGRHEDMPERWEFVGKVADDRIRRKYVGKSVARYSPKGARNPIKYVNC